MPGNEREVAAAVRYAARRGLTVTVYRKLRIRSRQQLAVALSA